MKNKNNLFSIIIPTFNDSKTISNTIKSVLEQTYTNFEIIIMNDGSTDETAEVLKKYKLNQKINCYYQDNADQLNAILNASKYINGNYVLILHSDDILANKKVLENSYNYFADNNCDAIMGHLEIMDKNGEYKGKKDVFGFKNKEYIKPLQLLWLGRNLYTDTAVFKRAFFDKTVKENYLMWNMPFWLSYNNKPILSNVHNVLFPLIRYRVFEDNYINNEIGTLNVLNGELRCALSLMNYYRIPFFKSQYFIFRIFNKLNLLKLYRPIYLSRPTKNKASVLDFIIKKRITNYENHSYLNSLHNFYKNKNNREIFLKLNNDKIYYGKDMKVFNQDIVNNKLDPIYAKIFEEMNTGFKTILVDKVDYDSFKIILKFLGINYDVNLEIRE